MADLIASTWSQQDADNTAVAPAGVQGSYSPSQVAPIIRAIMGSVKRFYDQSNAIYTTTGTGAAYVLTYVQGPTTYSKGIIYRFFAHANNTGAATININGLGAKSILSQHGNPLSANQIKTGDVVEIVYNGTSFVLISNEKQAPIFTGPATFNGSATLIDTNPTLALKRANTQVGVLSFDGSANTGNLVLQRFSPATGAAEGALTITGNGVNDLKFNGATVFHTGNDGAGSTLDADLLDGMDSTAFYRNNAAFGTTGNLTITNAAPSIVLQDSTASSYNTRIIVDGNNLAFQKSTDLSTWTTFMLMEMDTTAATLNGSSIWTDTNTTTAVINGKIGYTPSNAANSITAGNGLTGGGTLAATRTVTLGTPSAITNATTNSVTSTSHTHELTLTAADIASILGYTPANIASPAFTGTPTAPTQAAGNNTTRLATTAFVTTALSGTLTLSDILYTGTTRDNLNYPVGTTLWVYTGGFSYDRNVAVPVVLRTDNRFFTVTGEAMAGTALSGTWRSRGMGPDAQHVFVQRVS